METAVQVFLTTGAIIFGILLPVIIVAFIVFLAGVAKGVGPAMLLKAEELKKAPPFDEVEVNVSPATNVMTARFIKNGSVVWQGSSSRHHMEANGELKFTAEEATE